MHCNKIKLRQHTCFSSQRASGGKNGYCPKQRSPVGPTSFWLTGQKFGFRLFRLEFQWNRFQFRRSALSEFPSVGSLSIAAASLTSFHFPSLFAFTAGVMHSLIPFCSTVTGRIMPLPFFLLRCLTRCLHAINRALIAPWKARPDCRMNGRANPMFMVNKSNNVIFLLKVLQ